MPANRGLTAVHAGLRLRG